MNCHSAAFADGDRVIVEFQGQDWSQPKVIGFASSPQGCGSDYWQIGGQLALRSTFLYRNDSESWFVRSQAPAGRGWLHHECAKVLLNIYVMGGLDLDDPDDDAHSDCVSYDTETGAYSDMVSMLSKKMEFASFSLSNNIYVAGGLRAWAYGYGPIKDFEVYDSVTDSWQSKSDLSVGRWSPCAAEALGKGYLFHGRNESHGESNPSFVNSVFAYNPVGGSWSNKKSTPYGRCYAFGMQMVDKIYAMTGVSSQIKTAEDVEVFDANYGGIYRTFANLKYNPVANSWSDIEDYPYDGLGTIWGKSGAGSKSRGYQCGNKAFTGYFAALNPETDSWSELDANPNDPANNNWMGAVSL
jgi:hypothetical protein